MGHCWLAPAQTQVPCCSLCPVPAWPPALFGLSGTSWCCPASLFGSPHSGPRINSLMSECPYQSPQQEASGPRYLQTFSSCSPLAGSETLSPAATWSRACSASPRGFFHTQRRGTVGPSQVLAYSVGATHSVSSSDLPHARSLWYQVLPSGCCCSAPWLGCGCQKPHSALFWTALGCWPAVPRAFGLI